MGVARTLAANSKVIYMDDGNLGPICPGFGRRRERQFYSSRTVLKNRFNYLYCIMVIMPVPGDNAKGRSRFYFYAHAISILQNILLYATKFSES